MRLPHVILLAAVALIIVSCSEDDSTPNTPSGSDVLMPLAVGNEWVFDYNRYESGQFEYTTIDTLRVIGTSTDTNDVFWYEVLDTRAVSSSLYRNSSAGLEVRVEGIADIRLKYPASNGNLEIFETDARPYHILVMNNDTTVVTPAGTFQCMKYALGYEGAFFRHVFYSPGTGVIGYDDVDDGLSSYTQARLRSYHLE